MHSAWFDGSDFIETLDLGRRSPRADRDSLFPKNQVSKSMAQWVPAFAGTTIGAAVQASAHVGADF